MAKVFIGIALVFMLVTAGVGFMLKSNVDKLQAARNESKSKIADAEGKARAAKNDAEKAQKDAKEAAEKATTAEQAAAAKTKEAEDNKKAADELKLVIEGKDKEIADAKAKQNPLDPNTPTKEQLAALTAQVSELTAGKQKAEMERDEAKVTLDAQIAKGAANDQAVGDLKKKLHDRELNVMKAGLQGRILAVNGGWNFVVLSVGDKQGVVVNSTLLVVRGNDPIARLRVTSVEPSTSIADVLPGTVRRGSSIQPGDTVIFEGTRAQPGAKSAPDAPVSAPITPTTPALPN